MAESKDKIRAQYGSEQPQLKRSLAEDRRLFDLVRAEQQPRIADDEKEQQRRHAEENGRIADVPDLLLPSTRI